VDEACSAHGGDGTCVQNFGWRALKGKDHSEVLSDDGRTILKWILGKYCWGVVWIHLAQVSGSCEFDNEPSVSVKGGELLDLPSG
jgi:hypothetical protein